MFVARRQQRVKVPHTHTESILNESDGPRSRQYTPPSRVFIETVMKISFGEISVWVLNRKLKHQPGFYHD